MHKDIPADIEAIAEALMDDMHTHPDIRFSGILAGPTFERRIAEALLAERDAGEAEILKWVAIAEGRQ